MSTTTRERLGPALVLGALAFLLAGSRALHEPAWPTDFDQLWHAARALVRGVDPYSVVGPRDREFTWLWPLYYPLPAVLTTVPLSWMPVAVARVTFATLASATLGWAMGRRIAYLWPVVLSAAWIIAVSRTQWSPLLLAACWLPALAWVATAKPNVGLGAFGARVNAKDLRMAAIAAVVAIALSFVVRPDWFTSWRSAIQDSPHIQAPIARPLGFLLVLAIFKWRRADARLLLVMACVPHTPSLYDLLPLFFLCRSLREAVILALLTQVLFFGWVGFGSGNTFDEYAANLGRAMVWVVYCPALAAILTRPNEAADVPVLTATWRNAMPGNLVDALLCSVLIVAAFLLVWLPLVTTR